MENKKHHEEVNQDKRDKKDELRIYKYVQEEKILKLIDRMYNCEGITIEQFDAIYKYVEKKGHPSITGTMYLGLIATTEFGNKVIRLGDHFNNRISRIKRYPDCLIRS